MALCISVCDTKFISFATVMNDADLTDHIYLCHLVLVFIYNNNDNNIHGRHWYFTVSREMHRYLRHKFTCHFWGYIVRETPPQFIETPWNIRVQSLRGDGGPT